MAKSMGGMSGFSRVTSALACVLALIGASGCGGVYYAVEATGASSKLEEARTLGAEKLAPYEYYYAKEHLTQAQVEASEASYSDAADYADVADTYAQKAIEVSRQKRAKAAEPKAEPSEPKAAPPKAAQE